MALFKKILIANRGEIAIRITRSAREMGIHCIVIYSEAEKDALFVRFADEAVSLGEGSLINTYLNIQKIIQIAVDCKAEAIHPGYGFLSENPEFAAACKKHGLIFIGPSPEAIRLMGNKLDAIQFVSQLGIRTLDAIAGADLADLTAQALKLSFPVIIKAVAGGGGKGMRIVKEKIELQSALESASREALSYFGNPRVYVETYIENPRHIEVQILADHFGNAVHLFDRECSIQRRHQKIIEEAPSSILRDEARQELFGIALQILKAMKYTNAGTLEFLMDNEGRFYFLEMNTRIQVEHTVTEEITGFDIVKEQIRIAANQKLFYTQSEITVNSFAMECRVYAEDAFHDFLPSAGKISYYNQPVSSGTRIDAAVDGSVEISPDFDPLIAKVIVTGNSREEVIGRMEKVLSGYIIHGINTNIDFLKEVLGNPHFIANQVSTNFCIHHQDEFNAAFNNRVSAVPIKEIVASLLAFHYTIPQKDVMQNPVWYSLGYWRQTMNTVFEISGQRYTVTFQKVNSNRFSCTMQGERFEFSSTRKGHAILVYIDGKTCPIYVSENKENNFITIDDVTLILPKINEIELKTSQSKNISDMHSGNNLLSPLFGKVVSINCKPKDTVKKGEVILVIESMKMENNIIAPKEGYVEQILVNMGDKVAGGELLAVLSKYKKSV